MTSEEMNRAIEFLIQHEARMDAQQEEDKRLMQELVVNHKRMSDLIVIHSGRLDRMDEEINVAKQRLDRAEREDRAAQKRHEAWESRQEELEKRHNELRHELRDLFNRILDKLDERLQ
ncbi:MAG: hypothetical protein DMG16_01585 [Acidobacteria bacterium]|nr:MAG: hypothetical protein DMG16_01585 [Acidobacteriota bacterium]